MLIDDIKKQVETKCANYDSGGLCLLETGAGGDCRTCPFFNGEIGDGLTRCTYYENMVLPDDDKLRSRYWQSFGLSYWGEKSKVCKHCENVFDPGDKPRRQYCDECREVRRKESHRKRMREYRRKRGTK